MCVLSRSLLLFFIIFCIGACAQRNDFIHEDKNPAKTQEFEENRLLWKSCSRNDAEELALKAQEDGLAALDAAACYAFLARQGGDRAERLADAKEGRRMAETAVKSSPESGTAHYLTAYLIGLEAENDPARGLELVPILEREALTAAHLDPNIDDGGPDRMLGELYLRAPSVPISVGDIEKAIFHFRKAAKLAPDFLQNRIGLVEALTEDEDPVEACFEMEKIFARMPPKKGMTTEWKRAVELLKRICGVCNEK